MNETKLKSRKIGRYCCIKGCSNKYGNKAIDPVSFYHFPSNKFKWRIERRKKWVQAVIKHNKFDNDWQPTRYALICNAHFIGGRKSEHPLDPAYIPTIFPGKSLEKGSKINTKIKQCLKQDQIDKPSLNIPLDKRSSVQKVQTIELKTNCDSNKIKISCENEILQHSDSECQVNFLERKQFDNWNFNHLICNLKVENNLHCAETQVNIQAGSNQGTLRSKDELKTESINGYARIKKVEFYGISSIHSNNELTDFCGVTFEVFNFILKKLPEMKYIEISNANRLLIFLTKLKQGLSNSTLSILFNLPKTTTYKIFTETLTTFKSHVHWPSTSAKNNLPKIVKDLNSNYKAVINFHEIQIENSKNQQDEELFYSSNKDCQHLKLFLTFEPNGFIMHKSKCYSGQKSDKFIVEDCKFLDLVSCSDVILADKEYPNIKTLLENKKAIFVTPPVIEKSEFNLLYIKESIQRMKSFKILSSIPVEFTEQIDDIVQVCCSLINLQTSLKLNDYQKVYLKQNK